MADWLKEAEAALISGPGAGRPLTALAAGGAFVLFRQAAGVFQREESAGLPPGFQYEFLEKKPELWSPVLEKGLLCLPPGHGFRSDCQLWLAVDRPDHPGYLLVAELPGRDERDGDFVRLLLAIEVGRLRVGGSGAAEELPVWLRDFPGQLRRLESPVLLMAEPGSGMEDLVRFFVRANFGGADEGIFFHPGRLSEAVQLREIFGDQAGARLGGARPGLPLIERPGRLIFMQEAGHLAHQVQLRLYARLAGQEDDRFWIFGTSQDLEAMAQAGGYLSGLARFLARNRLVLPPVRVAREHLEEEIERLLDRARVRTGLGLELAPAALALLLEYDWPGNWWQLRQVIESAALLSSDGVIRPPDIRLDWPGAERPDDLNLRKRSEELEKSLLLQAHALHGGNQVQMARALGISRGSLQYKLEKYNLSRKEER